MSSEERKYVVLSPGIDDHVVQEVISMLENDVVVVSALHGASGISRLCTDTNDMNCDMRELFAERRYQEPTRLRGAAVDKRRSKKMKNKSRSKRK